MQNTPRFTAVTGFYDVNRSTVDKRSSAEYIGWLNQTLKLPLPFLVFLDPEFDADGIQLKPGDRIVRLAKADLPMFKHHKAVDHIIATSEHIIRRDIAFQLTEYGMVVNSKPALLKAAAKETDADFLVWIDAGHCRFIPDLSPDSLQVKAPDLQGMSFGMNITHFLAQRLRLGKISRQLIGKCPALMSAEDFIVARNFAAEFSDRHQFLIEEEWLPNGVWNNEQVAIGTLYLRGGLPGTRVLHTGVGGGGNTARWLFGRPLHIRKMEFYVVWKMLRDEFKLRSTPKKDCYLPGDFPEQAFQAWRKTARP